MNKLLPLPAAFLAFLSLAAPWPRACAEDPDPDYGRLVRRAASSNTRISICPSPRAAHLNHAPVDSGHHGLCRANHGGLYRNGQTIPWRRDDVDSTIPPGVPHGVTPSMPSRMHRDARVKPEAGRP